MEYQSLFQYPNTYPSITNYTKTLDGGVAVVGKYAADNALVYPKVDLEELEIIENTSFRFILGIRESEVLDDIRYFTSEIFYDDILASIAENNPYYVNNALNPNLFVYINLDNQLKLFKDLKLIDIATGVKQNQNLFILSDNSIDYITLVQYIDWLVGSVNPLDDENNGVIPAEKIADYEIGEYDPNTGEFKSNSTKTIALAARLETLLFELEQVNAGLEGISGDLPSDPKLRKTTAMELISVGFSALSFLQSVKGAVGAIKAAKSITDASGKIVQAAKIGNLAQGSTGKITEYSKTIDLSKFKEIPVSGVTKSTTAVSSVVNAANKTKGAISSVSSAVGKGIGVAGKATAKAGQFVAGLNKTVIGGAVQRAAVGALQTVPLSASSGALKSTNAKFFQTQAGQVTKVVAKQVGTEIAKAAAKKILGAAGGPITMGIMAAYEITKFFVGKAKEKKEYRKQKEEYNKVMGSFNQLAKRKEDIEFEINSILKSGKIGIDGKPKGDERFSSTQKYFQNIGRSILEKQQAAQTLPAG